MEGSDGKKWKVKRDRRKMALFADRRLRAVTDHAPFFILHPSAFNLPPASFRGRPKAVPSYIA